MGVRGWRSSRGFEVSDPKVCWTATCLFLPLGSASCRADSLSSTPGLPNPTPPPSVSLLLQNVCFPKERCSFLLVQGHHFPLVQGQCLGHRLALPIIVFFCLKTSYQGRGGGGKEVQREVIYVYLWLIFAEVCQKTTKFCKTIILQ